MSLIDEDNIKIFTNFFNMEPMTESISSHIKNECETEVCRILYSIANFLHVGTAGTQDVKIITYDLLRKFINKEFNTFIQKVKFDGNSPANNYDIKLFTNKIYERQLYSYFDFIDEMEFYRRVNAIIENFSVCITHDASNYLKYYIEFSLYNYILLYRNDKELNKIYNMKCMFLYEYSSSNINNKLLPFALKFLEILIPDTINMSNQQKAEYYSLQINTICYITAKIYSIYLFYKRKLPSHSKKFVPYIFSIPNGYFFDTTGFEEGITLLNSIFTNIHFNEKDLDFYYLVNVIYAYLFIFSGMNYFVPDYIKINPVTQYYCNIISKFLYNNIIEYFTVDDYHQYRNYKCVVNSIFNKVTNINKYNDINSSNNYMLPPKSINSEIFQNTNIPYELNKLITDKKLPFDYINEYLNGSTDINDVVNDVSISPIRQIENDDTIRKINHKLECNVNQRIYSIVNSLCYKN